MIFIPLNKITLFLKFKTFIPFQLLKCYTTLCQRSTVVLYVVTIKKVNYNKMNENKQEILQKKKEEYEKSAQEAFNSILAAYRLVVDQIK